MEPSLPVTRHQPVTILVTISSVGSVGTSTVAKLGKPTTRSKDLATSVVLPRPSLAGNPGDFSGAAVDIDVSKLNAGDVITFSVDIYAPDNDGLGNNLVRLIRNQRI